MDIINNLCMKCMHEIKEPHRTCPHCGNDNCETVDMCYLKPKTILQGKYLVGKSLDENGEGIGYIGYDIQNKDVIYIREFMPEKFCLRSKNHITIEVVSTYEELYKDFLEKFLSYARSIAKLRGTSSLIPIYDIFKENNTAYYVSDFVTGIDLESFVKKNGGKVKWDALRSLFMPALSAMSSLHKYGIMHLGLSPCNLLITQDQKLKICGFSISDVRQANAILVPELFNGYSAPEQYVIRERLTESADVYAFCACILFAVSGKTPPTASTRSPSSKLLISKNVLDSMPQYVVSAIADGLKVAVPERTHTFDELRRNLNPIKELINEEEPERKVQNNKKGNNIYPIIVSCMTVLIVVLIFAIFIIGGKSFIKDTNPETNSSTPSPSSSNIQSNEIKEQITVPNLSGVLLKDAQKAADTNGEYKVLLSEEIFSDTVVAGRIVSQTPAAGALVKRGSMIAVNVSKGAKIRKLPDVSNLPLSSASSRLSAAGFIPKKEEQFDDLVAEGLVIGYKDYSAEDELEYGTQIVIVVSKGKEGE